MRGCLILLILALFGANSALCKQDNQADSLWRIYRTSKSVVEQKNALFRLGEVYELKNNAKGRDSLIDIAVDDASHKAHDSILIELYHQYFEKDEVAYTDRAIDYSKSLSELVEKHRNNKWLSYAYSAKAKICLYRFDNKGALENASEAYYYAGLASNDQLKVKAMLLLGVSLENNNKKIEAFKKYTDALYLSKKLEDDRLIYVCYQKLASFYYLIDNRKKAKEYVSEQFKILEKQEQFDSVEYTKLNIVYATYLFDNNERVAAEKITQQVLAYSEIHGYTQLKQLIFSIYRTYLINEGHFAALANIYTKQYPDELHELSLSRPNLYLRLKAIIAEANNQPDSAEYYYSVVEQRLNGNAPDKIFVSNFFRRYGEFLLRRGKLNDAETKLQRAFTYAKDAQYLPYLTELAQELDSLYYSQGKTEEAYKYAKFNLQYSKQAELVHQEEELLKLEVENEARQRELMAQREVEETERKHNIQYMGISIMIVVFFIILAMLGSFRVPSFVLKGLGFISFIFFFEFIIMLADHKIHHITHGEPVTFLAFKIVLIAILLPLHHWMEHKVVHYLSTHKLIDTSKISLKGIGAKLFKPQAKPVVTPIEDTKEEPIEKH